LLLTIYLDESIITKISLKPLKVFAPIYPNSDDLNMVIPFGYTLIPWFNELLEDEQYGPLIVLDEHHNTVAVIQIFFLEIQI